MKGMFKRALAGVAAAALAATGLALGAGAANAATPVTSEQQITFTASELAQLQDHTLALYKLADYMAYGGEVYGIDTVDDPVENQVRLALDQAGITGVDDDEDPLAEVMSRDEGSGSLDDSLAAPYTGSTRDFVNALDPDFLGNPTKVTLGSTGYEITDSEGRYSVSVTVPAGIYVIYDVTDPAGNNAIPMMIGTAPVYKTAVVNMKNQTAPTKPDKEVVEGSDDDTVTIGDTVTFQITGTLSNINAYQEYTFTFTDTPGEGLTVLRDGMTINGKEIGAEEGQIDAQVSFSDQIVGDGNTSFTVTFDKTDIQQLDMLDGGDLKLQYKAIVNEAAPVDGVTNKATVSNNGATSGEGTSTLYYNDFKFGKFYADGTPATTAEFAIKNENGMYLKHENGVWSEAASVDDATKFNPDGMGAVSFHGLENGTYTVEETKAADDAMNIKPSFTVTLEYGETAFAKTTVTGDPYDLVDTEDKQLADAGMVAVVTNVKKVTQLPLTGAAGTALFTVLGLLIAGAGALVYMKSRNVKHALRG